MTHNALPQPDFDRHELIPVVVQDYRTRQVLMLAYANAEAYAKMLETGRTWFWSRSRQKLWNKGEESGHVQDIVGMRLDCDADTLLVFVRQTGVACHTGAMSCFYTPLPLAEHGDGSADSAGYDGSDIFTDLEDLIADRKRHPVEKSYTNYLFDAGLDKMCKKVGEEASETIIAAKNPSKDDLVGEISDLFYHVFVLMNERGVSLLDVEGELTKRHAKPQNKKDFHTRGEA